MSIASVSRLRNEMCYCIICIDGHRETDISGRIFNAYYRDSIDFENAMELLAKLEDIFDIFGYPHQTMDLRRSFSQERERDHKEEEHEGVVRIGLAAVPKAEAQTDPPRHRRIHVAPTTHLIKHNARGKLATLKTRIMFRQNAEWQGNVRWLETDMMEDFSSVPELLMLIDSVFE